MLSSRKCIILSFTQQQSALLTHLDGFLVYFMRSSAKLLQGPEGILPMYHYNVGTATWRDHLNQSNSVKHLAKQSSVSKMKLLRVISILRYEAVLTKDRGETFLLFLFETEKVVTNTVLWVLLTLMDSICPNSSSKQATSCCCVLLSNWPTHSVVLQT